MTASSDHPYPPLALATRVCGLGGWGDPYMAYEELGAQTKNALLRVVPDDWSLDGKRVLDFGCGAGRTLRHFLSEAERGEFWGTDIHAPSIEWLQENLCPPLHGWRCALGPPLGLPHDSFDLIWAISVFTHLADASTAWFLELHRLLKPGGLLIATYMGRWCSEYFAKEPWDEDRVGRNVLYHMRDWDAGGPAVLMSDWWVRAHWGRAFEIVDIAAQIMDQSWALLRKRDVELTAEDLEAPEDDPREYRAVAHNLRQIRRELSELTEREQHERTQREHLEQLREQHERALQQQSDELTETRRAYEQSLSWRVTRPLRAGARLGRELRSRRSL